jgi:hypothetical protein
MEKNYLIGESTVSGNTVELSEASPIGESSESNISFARVSSGEWDYLFVEGPVLSAYSTVAQL